MNKQNKKIAQEKRRIEREKDLISESKNHISFLEKKKEELTKKSEQKDKKGNSLITEQEKEDLKFLTDKLNEMSGVKSPFEKLKEDIDDNISKIPNLSEKLKYLNETQEKLFQKEGNSLYFLEANKEIEIIEKLGFGKCQGR